MPLEVRILRTEDFIRADASGRVDFEASRRLMLELSQLDQPPGTHPILLDARGTRGALALTDITRLVREMLEHRDEYRSRLAILVRADDQAERVGFMELFAQNRGVPIAAFTDEGEALRWLGVPPSGG